MHLYQGTTQQFIGDATQARLANQLADRFFEEFRYRPSPSEVTSWRNSLSAMAMVLQLADLTDQGILVEVRLPLSSRRLDVLITGQSPDHRRFGGRRGAQAVDGGGPVEHHRLRDGGLRRPPRRPPSPLTPGRPVPALPDRHAPGLLRRRDRPRRMRVPPLRAARSAVAAVPRQLRPAPCDEPVVLGGRAGRLRDLPRPAGRRPGRRSDPRAGCGDRVQASQAAARPRCPRHSQRAGVHAPRRAARGVQRDHRRGQRRRAEPSVGRLPRRGRTGYRQVGHRRQPRRGAGRIEGSAPST